MRRIGGNLCLGLAALVTSAGALAVPATSASAATTTAPAAAGVRWATLEQQAFQAVAGYRGDGALTATGAASPVVDSSVQTATGSISVVQRTVLATDRSGTVALLLTLLGGSQLVVNEGSPADGFQGAVLVLAPGTSSVDEAYPVAASAPATTTAHHRGRGHRVATDAVVHSLAVGQSQGGNAARLAVTGGCGPAPEDPRVITSDFGPLVQGTGVIECSIAETLGIIVSIYRGLVTKVGTTNGTTAHGSTLTLNTYYACTVISGTHDFRTSEIWSVNGTDEGGSTSGESALHCT